MRRDFLRLLAAAAAGSTFLRAFAAAPSDESPGGDLDVLKRPSAHSTRAIGAVMLALARAGTRLVAAGERGFILLSDDDGSTWRQARTVPVSVTLTAVHFANDQVGCAVGHLGVILRTEDGGDTWTLQLDGVKAANLALRDVEARHDAKAEAAARSLIEDGPDKPFLDVFFESPRSVYAVGAYGLAFRSDDGGLHWQCWMSHLDNPKGLHLYAIRTAGQSLFVAGEQGLFLGSNDGARRLTPRTSPYTGSYFGLVAEQNADLVLLGLRGRIFRSSDGGQNWVTTETNTKSSVTAGLRLADGQVLVATQSGELLISPQAQRQFKLSRYALGVPIHAVVQTRSGNLVFATMRGMRTVPLESVLS